MTRHLTVLAALTMSAFSLAQEFCGPADVLYIYDGDTYFIKLETKLLGEDVIFPNIKIRSANLDAPEVRGPEREEGLKTLYRLRELVQSAQETYFCTEMERGNFGRLLGVLFVDGESVEDILIREGLAKKYK